MSLASQLVSIALDDPKPAASAHPAFVAATLSDVTLQPAPIEPSWVVSGAPHASASQHSQSEDGCSSTTVWACTAGAFRWYFGWDETVHIVSGSVLVTDATGAQTRLVAGDIGYFAAGTWATWEIDDHVKKVAFCRRPFPAPVGLALRAKDKALRVMRRLRGASRSAPVGALTARGS